MILFTSFSAVSCLSHYGKCGFVYLLSPVSFCQGGIDFKNDNVRTLNHIPVVKYLLSLLRDKTTMPAEFRHASDRIMRLLLEEVISMELAPPIRK